MNLEKWLQLLTKRCLQNRLDAVLLSTCIFCCVWIQKDILLCVAKKKKKPCLNPSEHLVTLSEAARIRSEDHWNGTWENKTTAIFFPSS